MRIRGVALLVVAMLLGAACGNSSNGSGKTSDSGPATTVKASQQNADLNVFHPISETGVTDKEIRVSIVASINNPLGNNYGALADGVNAYFAMMNSQGGIYKRQLKVVNVRDDGVANNNTQIQAALAQDNPFAVFIAALLFTGANTLASQNVPTFGWNINAEWANHPTFFPNEAPLCFTCALPTGPWLATQIGAKKVGVLAYNVQQSADCLTGTTNSFAKFPTAKIVFTDKSLSFGVTDLSAQVAQMKAKGVQLVLTCMDLNGVFTLAKEMRAQGLNVPQELPNGYDQAFMKANGKYFEGSYVAPQFLAFEHRPQPPEMKTFLEWMQKTNKKVVELSMQGWIAANQFVHALKLAGPDFTRAKLVSAMNTEKAFTADGLIAPIDWTRDHTDPLKRLDQPEGLDCSNWVKVENSTFVSQFTQGAKPWICFKVADEKRSSKTPMAVPAHTNETFVNTGS
jgi:branched-chain amino acid transport system substrate-binding protein